MYQDTDSMHMLYDDVPKLEKLYEAEYKKELTGTNLEQFHIDFNLDGACSAIYSKKSIFLGKKSYIDFLESTDKDGNIINGFHTRLKGITSEGLEHEAKKSGGMFELYRELAEGKEKIIWLNPVNFNTRDEKVLFEFKNFRVKTRGKFTRGVKF
jgi:hypothetical protein